MSGDTRGGSADLLSPPKVFKFHNISKDRILGGKKIKKDGKQKLHLKIRASSLDNSVEKDRTHIILQKYIPIKQKSEEIMNTEFVETKTCHVDFSNLQSEKATISKDTYFETSQSTGGGLRLKNISTLLQEPRRSINVTNFVDVNHSPHQEAPLDLSKGSKVAAPLVSSRKPLDLSIKPKQVAKIAPKHQILLKSKSIQTNDSTSSNGNQSFLLTKGSAQELLQFVMVDKKCISKPLNSQPYKEQTWTETRRDSPVLANYQTTHPDREISTSSSSSSSTNENPSSPGTNQQAPIQMLFLNGQLARVLPNLDDTREFSKSIKIKDNKPNEKTKTFSDGSRTSGSMVKTNETVTKNGDLFCTFKNVKQIKLIKEQQLKRSRQKKK